MSVSQENLCPDVFSAIFQIGRDHTGRAKQAAHSRHGAVQTALCCNIRTVGITERRNIFQDFGRFRNICHQIQKIHDGSKTQPCARAAFSQKRGYAERYAGQLDWQKKMGRMHPQHKNDIIEEKIRKGKDIALSLELFVSGSLNIFNHQANVDIDNRFTVYGIRDLGAELSPITMLVMLESIQQRIVENGLYIDEFLVFLNSEYSAKYLQQL